ncbi:MAG: hypothetical protein KJO91_06910, partial [Gammaproteobacteria bacterium]|nr:hypothetical protein [Gammaproteobacteria bacterium]
MSVSVPPIGDDAKRIGAYFTPLAVDAQAFPDMTVRIQPGSFYTNLGEHREYVGGNSPTISAPTTSGAKWVVVALNENALIDIFNGAVSSNPDLPVLPENVIPLAGIFVGDTATVITSDMVFDLRPLWSIRPENIPNLAGELADRPTTGDVNALLAQKADIGGTPEPSFVLNQDQVGVPGTNAELVVERGANPNVSIRWNETANQWEFSNDGSTWDPVGASSGVYYTQTALDGGQLDSRYYTKVQLDGGQLNTLYYSIAQVDAALLLKADATHTHVVADITNFAAEVTNLSPVKTVAGKTGHVTLVEADITDLDKYDTVPGAVIGNMVTFGAGTLVDSGYVPTDFALATHTHVAADVTDFTASADARIAAASIDDLSDVQAAVSPVDGHVLAYQTSSGWYLNRFLNLGELGDVVESGPVAQHALIHNGAAWINRLLDKSDISDFVEGAYVHTYAGVGSPVPAEDIYGEKTFNADVNVNGNLVVSGASTNLLTSSLQVEDDVIEINVGETGAGVDGGTGNAGITVKRGSLMDAVFQWDEGTQQWLVGVVGSASPVVDAAHGHVVANITDFGLGVTTELGNNDLDTMQDVAYPAAPMNGQVLYWGGSPAHWMPMTLASTDLSDFATAVTAELNVNSIDELADVDLTGGALGNALFWEGSPPQLKPRDIVKSDVADFVEGDYLHTYAGVGSPVPAETAYGDKTFADNVDIGGNLIVTGDLTVQGDNNVINTSVLTVEDNIVEVNKGEGGAGVGGGAGNAGIQVDRGTLTDAVLVWDELNTQWEAGTLGSTVGISLQGHTHVLAEVLDVTASALEVNQLNGIALGPTNTVQLQLNDRIRRSVNEAMDPGINLSFSAGGEVLGLPATPTVNDAAASKLYVDTVAAGQNELRELDDTVVAGETSGDFLVWEGSPAAWRNRAMVETDISDLGATILVNGDIGSTVQAWGTTLDNLNTIGATTAADQFYYSTGAGVLALGTVTAAGRALMDDADASTQRTTLGLVIGTNVQAWDAGLDGLALVSA